MFKKIFGRLLGETHVATPPQPSHPPAPAAESPAAARGSRPAKLGMRTPGKAARTLLIFLTQPSQLMPSILISVFCIIYSLRIHCPGRQRRSMSELVTTDTELSAIAAPANTGLR